MKKLQKKINRQLKIEKFFKEQLWQILIVFAFVYFCAWLFNKYIEAVLFCISHTVVRMLFDKQYHCGTIALCLITTCSVAFFGIMSLLPIEVSILSAIPVAYIISWVGYVVQDRIDLKVKAERTLFDLPKDELLAYMENSTLRLEEKDAIQYYVIDKMKGERFYNAMGYCKKQSIRIYKSAVNKLNNLIRQ